VPPEEQSQTPFNWETSLAFVRSAFTRSSAEATSALFWALDDAARMADHCQDELLKQGPEPLPPKTFKEWERFLLTLYKDAGKVYPRYLDLVESDEGDLQTTFETIRNAARDALLPLQDMNTGKRSRRAAVIGLSKLVNELEAARAELGPQPEANEAHGDDETRTGIVSQEAVSVPLVGRIPAGRPFDTEEWIEDNFPLPRQLVGEGTLFLLKVIGDSMIDAAIADGDWVVVRQQQTAENGEIVAAMTDEGVTVKTFKRSDDGVWLVPRNEVYPRIPMGKATILGKVVAVLRRL
jgi:SOS-response transcriptional repressor LexA